MCNLNYLFLKFNARPHQHLVLLRVNKDDDDDDDDDDYYYYYNYYY